MYAKIRAAAAHSAAAQKTRRGMRARMLARGNQREEPTRIHPVQSGREPAKENQNEPNGICRALQQRVKRAPAGALHAVPPPCCPEVKNGRRRYAFCHVAAFSPSVRDACRVYCRKQWREQNATAPRRVHMLSAQRATDAAARPCLSSAVKYGTTEIMNFKTPRALRRCDG